MDHRVLLLGLALLALMHPSTQQVNINVEIAADPDNVTLEETKLNVDLQQANLSAAYIQSITVQELLVDICHAGTFSPPSGGSCIDCPSGTASTAEGASNDMTCAACSAGSFAATASSVCTDCPANTFSPTYKAASIAQCLTCPPDTTSTSGSNNVRSCVCNNGLFVSNNLVAPFDGIIASLGFEGAASISLPHVVC
jgi:hypothetical protein